MEKVKVVEILPISGAGCGSIRISANSVYLDLEYEFEYKDQNITHVGKIKFLSLMAFRFRDEMHGAGYVSGSYDSLVEIQGSEWVKELHKKEPDNLRISVSKLHHYAVFLSSNGYLEVIAEGIKFEKPREGMLG